MDFDIKKNVILSFTWSSKKECRLVFLYA